MGGKSACSGIPAVEALLGLEAYSRGSALRTSGALEPGMNETNYGGVAQEVKRIRVLSACAWGFRIKVSAIWGLEGNPRTSW